MKDKLGKKMSEKMIERFLDAQMQLGGSFENLTHPFPKKEGLG